MRKLIESRFFEAPPPLGICADAPNVLIQARFDGTLHERELNQCEPDYATMVRDLAVAANAGERITGSENRF